MQGGEGMGGGMAVVFIPSPKNIFPKSLQTDCEATWKENCLFLTTAVGKFKSNEWFLLSCPLYWEESIVTVKNGKIFQSAFRGETEHPRSFVLSSAPLAEKPVMGEMGRFSLVGMSICFPLLRLVC